MDVLNRGEKSKILLAGLLLHCPGILLLDEPTNHLDRADREKLYHYITTVKVGVVEMLSEGVSFSAKTVFLNFHGRG
jgi:ATPase subunit of ABC transporter with duplicated ATPase domains